MALALIDGIFDGVGPSDTVAIHGWFNLSLSGSWSATISLERSFDDGASWRVVESFTSNAERRGYEPESGIKYRAICSSYTSGDIILRVSQ